MMSEIVLGGGEFPGFDARTLRGMFAFRHQVFFNKLKWDVETRDNLEYDLFDTMNPVYMLARQPQGAIEGCWRLMPTTDDYMLKDTFPQLLRGESVPCDPHVWELSRFAVDASSDAGAVQAPLNGVTMEMIRRLYDFAQAREVARFVTVSPVRPREWRQNGVRPHLADPLKIGQQHLLLCLDLLRSIQMLQAAAATDTGMRTAGRHPLVGCADHLVHLALIMAFAFGGIKKGHRFTRQGAIDKYRLAVDVRHTAAIVREGFYAGGKGFGGKFMLAATRHVIHPSIIFEPPSTPR